MQQYDKNNYEFKKPSGMIQSKIFKIEKKKRVHYELSPIQFDTMNLMMYSIKESLMKTYGSTEKIIDIIENDFETFEKIIDTNWYEISWEELFSFTGRMKDNHSKISLALDELEDVKVTTNVFDKNKNLGQTTFSLLRKYTKFKNKIKFKLEPELFQMILFQQPLTNESFAVLKLKCEAQNLKTVGAKRIYEFLKDWEFRGSTTLHIDDLKIIMNLNAETESNTTFAMINRNHLKPAITEINMCTDLKISISTIKEKNDGERLKTTKIKFTIEKQSEGRLKELGLIQQSIESLPFYNKSKAKLDNLVKGGYKVVDEEAWIETDIKKNEEKYNAEVKLDLWIKTTPQDQRNDVLKAIAIEMDDCDDLTVYIKDYKLTGIFSQEILTRNAKETIEWINKIIDLVESEEKLEEKF